MSEARGIPLRRSGRLAAWALVVIAVAAVVVPLLASRDPLAIRDVLAQAIAAGYGDGDLSSVICLFEDWAKVTVR